MISLYNELKQLNENNRTLVIRYNPDKYRPPDGYPEINTVLHELIVSYITSTELPWELSCIKLFYDGYNCIPSIF